MTASPLIVLERAVQLHRLLDAAAVPHAIGGALALAYHVGEARATRDIDLNVGWDADDPASLFRLLPEDVPWSGTDVEMVRTTGQVRLWWPHPDGQPPIPLDLFFPQGPLHELVNQRAERVAMLDDVVPILSATDLSVFKMLFDRRKDWADIEELLRYGKVHVDEARRWLTEIVGPDDPRQRKLDDLVAEVRSTHPGP
jgi:hypothetical protein